MPRTDSPQRVALVYHDSLLAQGVRAVLESFADFQVDAVDLDEAGARDHLWSLDPSLIIVDVDDLANGPGALSSLVDGKPDLRVVCLHNGGNFLDIYQKRRVPIRGARDLAGAITAV